MAHFLWVPFKVKTRFFNNSQVGKRRKIGYHSWAAAYGPDVVGDPLLAGVDDDDDVNDNDVDDDDDDAAVYDDNVAIKPKPFNPFLPF